MADFLRESYQEFGDIKINVNAVSQEELLRTEVQNIWLAPDVGMVKIEDEDGITELIEYTIAE